MKFYLRIEGVNLNNFVFDTADLSTMRGGSLLLLEAINQLQEHFKFKNKPLHAISTGASSGLFTFEADSSQVACDIKTQVMDFLFYKAKYHERFKHATFVINVLPVPVKEDFEQDREQLLTLNRWQQMQSPTVVFPGKAESSFANDSICQKDFVRPTNRGIPKKNPVDFYSESVYQRRQYGRWLKNRFYQQEIEKLPICEFNIKELPLFVQDLGELTKGEEWGNLHGKMAVIYLDGNGFGKIQQNCLNPEQLQEFDTTIKHYRRRFLHDLLQKIIKEPKETGWLTQDKRLRLEILMWGGDELLLVVPAWKGWWTLNFFFEASQNWYFQGKHLTHAAGLVFCHHNAPIHRIKELAYDIANFTKDKKSRESSYVAYQILESFNETGLNREEFWERRLGSSGIKPKELFLAGEQMCRIEDFIVKVKEALSKNEAYKIVELLLKQPTQEVTKAAKEAVKEIETNQLKDVIKTVRAMQTQSSPVQKEQLQDILNLGEEKPECYFKNPFWLHLIELWDYI